MKILDSYTFENIELHDTAFVTHQVALYRKSSKSDLLTTSRTVYKNPDQFKVLVGKSQKNGGWFLFEIPKKKAPKHLTATKCLSDGEWVSTNNAPLAMIAIEKLIVVVIYPGIPTMANNRVSKRQINNPAIRRWKKDYHMTSK